MKRLLIEELERRAMLSADAVIAMASTGLSNNSVEDFYKSQTGTEAGGAAGVGMFDDNIGPISANVGPTSSFAQGSPNSRSAYPEATTGVGQMVITTGANTPGIGSFAMPIAGPSRAGGTGDARVGGGAPARTGAAVPDVAAATDAAIELLSNEMHDLSVAERKEKSSSIEVSKKVAPQQPTGRRAWDIDTDNSKQAADRPAATGAKR
jgi:hypothetical protein